MEFRRVLFRSADDRGNLFRLGGRRFLLRLSGGFLGGCGCLAFAGLHFDDFRTLVDLVAQLHLHGSDYARMRSRNLHGSLVGLDSNEALLFADGIAYRNHDFYHFDVVGIADIGYDNSDPLTALLSLRSCRSEERRVGKGGGSKCRSRWWP